MQIQTEKYQRKSFTIDAVRVTEENMQEIAKWCMGTVEEYRGRNHIFVRVHNPLSERQTKAFAGDWVLYSPKGFKVYTERAFNRNFEPVQTSESSAQ